MPCHHYHILLLFLLYTSVVVTNEASLSEYIHRYESLDYDPSPVIDYDIVEGEAPSDRHRRSLDSDSSDSHRYHRHRQIEHRLVNINFNALGREFKLRLKPDATSVFSHNLRVEGPDGEPLHLPLDHIYSGHLENTLDSHVYGSVRDGIFEGKIFIPNGSFYVERSHKYFKGRRSRNVLQEPHPSSSPSSVDESTSPFFHSVIYKSEDVKHPILDKVLGSGCASNIDPQVTEWMERVSNSAVRDEDNVSSKKDDAHERVKRGAPSFSSSSRDHAKEDGHTINVWRNAQSRISHERKEFHPGSNLIANAFPSSTVKHRACSLYIQTDTYLWDHIRKEVSTDSKAREEIASLVAQHIKAVNHIYENSDFHGIRGLKFIVQRLRINDTSACDTPQKRDQNQFCSPNIDVSNFLNLNSQFNHNDFCLAYIFTYRDFSGGTLGLAWVASTSGASGGICEKYKSYTENIHGRQVQTKRSLNTGIITFVNYNSRVPPKVSELTLAHEIGHNFGSPHDYPSDCRPGGTQGNYIMYSSATSGERPNNNKFSPCSVRNISSVLQAVFNGEGKENCFQEDDGPFCGNKIVEEGEECDCGYDSKECTEQCCYPREIEPYRDQEPDAKPCKRRRGAVCSPSEGPCCSERCRYEANDKLCRHEAECTLESYCNGYRPTCPAAPAKANKTECNGGTQVCWAGACVGSICQKYDMEECFLTSRSGAKPDEMCEVACQRSGDMLSCRRTSEIGEMKNISGLKLRPGSPCNDFQGYCDVFQRCRAVDAEGPLAMLKNLLFNQYTLMTIKQWATTYWWACMLMGVALIIFMAAFIKCCAVHTPSNNPKKKPALRISDTLRRPADTLRRKRHRSNQGHSRGHHSQAILGSGANAGPSIPLQPSAPQELMPSTSSYPPPPQHALPPIPSSHPHHSTQPQGNMCPNLTVHGASSSGMNQSQQTAFNALQLQQSQLVVALPPESASLGHTNGHHGGGRSQAYLPEPPPPYPGHPPSLPPRPNLVSSSLTPSRPNLPSPAAIAGPSHGYGEGRGHYNRRSSNSHAANMSASSNSGFGHKNSSAGGKNSKMR